MKTQHQIKLIKVGYLLTLIAVFLFSLEDMEAGFNDGYKEGGKTGVLYLSHGLLILCISLLTVRVLIYLYRLIDSVQQDLVFSEDNAVRLKRMGWYCIVIPFLLFVFHAMEYVNERGSAYTIISVIIQKVDFQIWLLIFGLTLLTIGFVFKKGMELKQESDLTV